MQAKDVNIGNRPVSDFEDPTPKRNFNRVDFQSILQVAVLRVSKTSIGRPNIGVFEEVDRIWKNTVDYKVWFEVRSTNTTLYKLF